MTLPKQKYFDFTINIRTDGAFEIQIPILYDFEINESIKYVYDNIWIHGETSIKNITTPYGQALNITGYGNVTLHANEKNPPYLYYPFTMQEWGKRHLTVKVGPIQYWVFCNSSGTNLEFNQRLFEQQESYNFNSEMGGKLTNGWQVIKGHSYIDPESLFG